MPYIHAVTSYPSPSSGAEMRALLEARTRAFQEDGVRASLGETLYGVDVPAFHLTLQLPDLAAADRYWDEVTQRHPLPPELLAMSRQPISRRLSELLVPGVASPTPGRYLQRFYFRPALGRFGDARRTFIEYIRWRQAQGDRSTVAVGVAGDDVSTFIVSTTFASLAEIEQLRAVNQTDPARAAFTATINSLLAAPAMPEIRRLLIPAPPAS